MNVCVAMARLIALFLLGSLILLVLFARALPGGADGQSRSAFSVDGDGFRLSGTKFCVPAAELADCVLVPAATPDGRVHVFLVDPKAQGVSLTPLATTTGQPEAIASRTGSPKPSYRDGNTKSAARRYSSAARQEATGIRSSSGNSTAKYSTTST